MRVMIHGWVRSPPRGPNTRSGIARLIKHHPHKLPSPLPLSNLLLTVPRRYFHYSAVCSMLCCVSLANVLSLNNYVHCRYIQFSSGNRVATILGKGCQLCLPSVFFFFFFFSLLIVFVCLSFDVENFNWIWLYQLLRSLIYIPPKSV